MALAGKRAEVKVSGEPIAFNNQDTSSVDNRVYQIVNQNMRVWHRSNPISVLVDGLVPDEGYRINRLLGQVVFDSIDPGRGDVTVSGDYLPMSRAAGAYEYTCTIDGNNIERSEFGDEWIRRVQGLKDVSGELSVWYELDPYFYDALTNESIVVIEFYVDGNSDPDIKCWGILSSDEMSAAVDGLVVQSVSFEGVLDVDQRVVSLG